ncbi:MAG: peptidoglycan editing factor PgeF [Gammaproteobacteria bacterium]
MPTWPAPRGVKACTTTRSGGVSLAPYDTLNLAAHVGDRAPAVLENRKRLKESLGLPAEPVWLDQVHGTEVIDAADIPPGGVPKADAVYTQGCGSVCAILTADCMPLLLSDRAGKQVAAVHAGWRGLAAGVIETTVAALKIDPAELIAWMGPAIGPQSFEVGDEVRDIFLQYDSAAECAFMPSTRRPTTDSALTPGETSFWLADIYRLTQRRLAVLGVQHVYGGKYDTFSDNRFYSYRRANVTGRMATLIWLDEKFNDR